MGIVVTERARMTLRLWNALLAWHRPHEHAGNLTNEQFCKMVRELAQDNGKIGKAADILLDDYIRGVRFHPLDKPGELIPLHSLPNTTVNQPSRISA